MALWIIAYFTPRLSRAGQATTVSRAADESLVIAEIDSVGSVVGRYRPPHYTRQVFPAPLEPPEVPPTPFTGAAGTIRQARMRRF